MSSELDDLLKLLEDNKHIPGNDVEKFIHDYKVKSSKKTTNNLVIYWVYLKWVAKAKVSPLPRNVFFKLFKKYFKQGSRDSVRRYYVESKHFMLHPADVEAAAAEARRERRWYALVRSGKKHTPGRNLKNEYWRKAQKVSRENNRKRKLGIE